MQKTIENAILLGRLTQQFGCGNIRHLRPVGYCLCICAFICHSQTETMACLATPHSIDRRALSSDDSTDGPLPMTLSRWRPLSIIDRSVFAIEPCKRYHYPTTKAVIC